MDSECSGVLAKPSYTSLVACQSLTLWCFACKAITCCVAPMGYTLHSYCANARPFSISWMLNMPDWLWHARCNACASVPRRLVSNIAHLQGWSTTCMENSSSVVSCSMGHCLCCTCARSLNVVVAQLSHYHTWLMRFGSCALIKCT